MGGPADVRKLINSDDFAKPYNGTISAKLAAEVMASVNALIDGLITKVDSFNNESLPYYLTFNICSPSHVPRPVYSHFSDIINFKYLSHFD